MSRISYKLELEASSVQQIWKLFETVCVSLSVKIPDMTRTRRYCVSLWGPQPKPLAQKPNREAAVLGWKYKYITIFTEHFATHVPTPNLEGQETVFVRPLPMDQSGMRDSVSVTRTPPV
ncbi:hypothetical protein CSKR_105783 [Clonorchis sinensis]|uniref:Uncharacterized protein n=1 Tax=Clonorchis sinensis TaxID=79923 RepID=A0A3R7D287_CLOSI|nr:hypothetical protein CSKR_105783 [Clonorchis sinensis]